MRVLVPLSSDPDGSRINCRIILEIVLLLFYFFFFLSIQDYCKLWYYCKIKYLKHRLTTQQRSVKYDWGRPCLLNAK